MLQWDKLVKDSKEVEGHYACNIYECKVCV